MAGFKIDAGAFYLQRDPEIDHRVVAYLGVVLPVEGAKDRIPAVGIILCMVAQVETCLQMQRTAEQEHIGVKAVLACKKRHADHVVVAAVLQHFLQADVEPAETQVSGHYALQQQSRLVALRGAHRIRQPDVVA